MTNLIPLLIAPLKRSIGVTGYGLGWLFEFEDKALWVTWGNTRDKDSALACAREVLQKKGQREVLIWNKPLTKDLTVEQVAEIRKNGGVFIHASET